jgi:hypothetical protein
MYYIPTIYTFIIETDIYNIYTFLGMSIPGTEKMYTIMLMYFELICIGFIILINLTIILYYILTNFYAGHVYKLKHKIDINNYREFYIASHFDIDLHLFLYEFTNYKTKNTNPVMKRFYKVFKNVYLQYYYAKTYEFVYIYILDNLAFFFLQLYHFFILSLESYIVNKEYVSYLKKLPKKLNNYLPKHFSPQLESVLELLFLLFPTFIIIHILLNTIGFIYDSEYDLESMNYDFTIDVIGHQ